MMKKILLVFLFFYAFSAYTQELYSIKKSYISLKSYNRLYKTTLTKNDSLNFRYKDGDTLVLLDEGKKRRGSRVLFKSKDSTFLEVYKRIAFRQTKEVNKEETMKYWKDELKIFFTENASDSLKNDFKKFAERIDRQVDSLSISFVNNVEDSNYIIYFFGDEEYEPGLKSAKNSDLYLYWNGRNQIYKARIKIKAQYLTNDTSKLPLLKQYFVNTLGYFGVDNKIGCNSIYSGCISNRDKLSRTDLEILRYHYSYAICKGTTLREFERIHKKGNEFLDKKQKYYILHLD